ncbi:MAG: MoaD/ThiS family protein [Planctomycetaceae bacterium]
MSVRIELFGIPRRRAGVAAFEVAADDLGTALVEAGKRFPEFARECLVEDRLRPGYLAAIGGRTFATDPATPLADGDSVQILSADVGG